MILFKIPYQLRYNLSIEDIVWIIGAIINRSESNNAL